MKRRGKATFLEKLGFIGSLAVALSGIGGQVYSIKRIHDLDKQIHNYEKNQIEMQVKDPYALERLRENFEKNPEMRGVYEELLRERGIARDIGITSMSAASSSGAAASIIANRKNRRIYEEREQSPYISGGTPAILTIGISIILAVIFLSPNLTGNAISNLTLNSSNIIGIILFFTGILGVFLLLKIRNSGIWKSKK